MPFINKKQAFKLLDDMIAGKQNCIGDCRRIWLKNIGYALKTETNPLNKLVKYLLALLYLQKTHHIAIDRNTNHEH